MIEPSSQRERAASESIIVDDLVILRAAGDGVSLEGPSWLGDDEEEGTGLAADLRRRDHIEIM